MADILCRWRNATPKTVCLLVNDVLPHNTMSYSEFRQAVDAQFLRTGYQLACQLGLYYIDNNNVYIPRFTHNIDNILAKIYLEFWIQRYYAPNPYTKSLTGIETPIYLVNGLIQYIEGHGGEVNLKTALTEIYKDPMGNMDILTNALNNYSKVIKINNGKATLVPNYTEIMKTLPNRYDKKAFFENFSVKDNIENVSHESTEYSYRQLITAIKTKPFVILAGISGTGKSRIVRELARSCWDKNSEEYLSQKPSNFEMIQIKPNWHDSTELMGYVSRIGAKPTFIIGPFLRFIAKAWEHIDIPYFLCLDEMNLAPVEQYFAEYLSVIESRKVKDDGKVTTDPILSKNIEDWYRCLTDELVSNEDVDATLQENIRNQFLNDGIAIPQNLIVIGTVNMDETTFSFSRKVLDRAMTIEMNSVDLWGGLDSHYEPIGKLNYSDLIGSAVEGVDVYQEYKEVCDKVLNYLQSINDVLEGTPFKIAYRTRNEFLLYVINNLPYNKDTEGNDLPQDFVIARALDEVTSMKILSRIEGDDTKVSHDLLKTLSSTITNSLNSMENDLKKEEYVSIKKINEMEERLNSGYTSFWS